MNNYEKIKDKYPEMVKALENARSVNRLAHAFLIQADLATSRNQFASALAMIACCPNSKNGVPCQVCHICRGIESDTYADMAKVTPEGKAFFIKVGDTVNPALNSIRGFTESFYLTKISSANKKVGIIYDAERMNAEAQNALLKTLEEPPKDSLIILASGNPKTLLPTTISRCHLITLCDKKIEFDFAGNRELFKSLWEVFNADGDMMKLEFGAASILEVANKLKDDAAIANEAEFAPKIEVAKEFDERLAKRLSLLMADNAVGLYIGKRQQFLSAIHSFFAQLALLAGGAKLEELPNKEIFDSLDMTKDISLERALNAVQLADQLIYSFKFFVNEPLAIRNFIFNL